MESRKKAQLLQLYQRYSFRYEAIGAWPCSSNCRPARPRTLKYRGSCNKLYKEGDLIDYYRKPDVKDEDGG